MTIWGAEGGLQHAVPLAPRGTTALGWLLMLLATGTCIAIVAAVHPPRVRIATDLSILQARLSLTDCIEGRNPQHFGFTPAVNPKRAALLGLYSEVSSKQNQMELWPFGTMGGAFHLEWSYEIQNITPMDNLFLSWIKLGVRLLSVAIYRGLWSSAKHNLETSGCANIFWNNNRRMEE